MSKIHCHYCARRIRDRDELITASKWFRLKAFHYQCFQDLEQESTLIRNVWIPVNGVSGNISAILMLLLSIGMLATELLGYIGDLLGVIALYPVILRLISLLFIEMRLPNYIENKKPLDSG
ncbi:hypothetical protein SAMN05421676_102216 [Salinibacillus kushneri]|uniref:Uncharacterized protein n=1 Tax=Salinibacillus kushneri TaxID=237682 RepID=A0A1I0AP23_9BACI|nr:hypothetical protein [Salinibacillus kushneri]SES96018.1 hypothetical protein SAMN05421676_102216 [Salinibacillus kushneri]